MNLDSSKSIDRARSRSLRHVLFDKSSPAGRDLRGFVVYDLNHKRIGIVGDVYCHKLTLKPRYIEIVLINEKIEKLIMYPYEFVACERCEGPLFLASTIHALVSYEEYESCHIMQNEGSDLIPFGEAVGFNTNEKYLNDIYRGCA